MLPSTHDVAPSPSTWKPRPSTLDKKIDSRYRYPPGPPGCAQRKALESQLFLVQFKDAFISTFQRLDLH